MNYQKITNPVSGKKVSIHSTIGKKILVNYLSFLNGGLVNPANIFTEPQFDEKYLEFTNSFLLDIQKKYNINDLEDFFIKFFKQLVNMSKPFFDRYIQDSNLRDSIIEITLNVIDPNQNLYSTEEVSNFRSFLHNDIVSILQKIISAEKNSKVLFGGVLQNLAEEIYEQRYDIIVGLGNAAFIYYTGIYPLILDRLKDIPLGQLEVIIQYIEDFKKLMEQSPFGDYLPDLDRDIIRDKMVVINFSFIIKIATSLMVNCFQFDKPEKLCRCTLLVLLLVCFYFRPYETSLLYAFLNWATNSTAVEGKICKEFGLH